MADPSDNQPSCVLIFGGTFDPPHCAHTKLPELAAAQLKCDEIVYVPAAINPLKTEAPPTPREHRLAMLLLAIHDVPNARVSTLELDRAAGGRDEGPSYTIDTLRALRAAYANATFSRDPSAARGALPPIEFRLFIGCDQALNFHHWKDWQQILLLATPAVMIRPPWNSQSYEAELRKKYSDIEAESWLGWTLRLPLMDVNATEIRRRVRAGEPLQGLVAPQVEAYIRANNLYRD